MTMHQVWRKLVSADHAAPAFMGGPKAHIADLDGDGVSDIVWTGVVGSPWSNSFRTLIWKMAAGSVTPASTSFTDSATTEVIAVGNFNADFQFAGSDRVGRAGLLTRATRSDGMVTVVSASGISTNIAPVPASTRWVVKAVGDFNDDSRSDVLWYNDLSGQIGVWEGRSNGSMEIMPVLATTVPRSSGWTIVGTAGVPTLLGNSGIIWQHKVNKQMGVWTMLDSTHELIGPTQNFNGTMLGVMNMGRPLAPINLAYGRGGDEVSITLWSPNRIVGTGVPTAQIWAGNQDGSVFLGTGYVDLDGTSQFFLPASLFFDGGSTCIWAGLTYHGRLSDSSAQVCSAWHW